MKVIWHARARDCSALLWRSALPRPLEGFWWYEALEAAGLENQFAFRYAEVSDAQGRPVVLAPAFVMQVPLELVVPPHLLALVRYLARWLPALLHQRTLFIGSPCVEHGWVGFDPLLDEAGQHAALACLQEALVREAARLSAPMRVWKDVPGALHDALAQALAPRQLFSAISFPGTRLSLPTRRPGETPVDAWLRGIKGSRRQKMRRTLRQSHAAAVLTCEIVQAPDQALLTTLFSLFEQTFHQAQVKFERLTLAFFQAVAQAAGTRFLVLRAPGQDTPVAFMLTFQEGRVLINKFIGIDYQQPRGCLLYFRLFEACVELAYQLGLDTIDSGQTEYDAKISLGHQLLPLWNHAQHANPLLHRVYALVGRRISWASLDASLTRLAAGEAVHASARADGASGSAPIHGNP